MKRLILAALVSTFAASAYAQGPTCKAEADDQKLVGSARKTFMDKCEKNATKSCGIAAAEKKLKGPAKTAFTKKCVTDQLGTDPVPAGGGTAPRPTTTPRPTR
jgi:psiF repeat